MSRHYILKGKEVIPEDDMLKAVKQFDSDPDSGRVGRDVIGDVTVSTVFLVINHSYGMGEPELFETMVFGGPLDQEQIRYATWDQAFEGHQAMVERVKAEIK